MPPELLQNTGKDFEAAMPAIFAYSVNSPYSTLFTTPVHNSSQLLMCTKSLRAIQLAQLFILLIFFAK